MSYDLSEDLIVEIFSRLPIKSLLRFRSVSKSLRACIGSPSFIRLHTLRSQKKLTIIHRIRYKGEAYPKCVYTSHSEDQHAYNNLCIGITPVDYPFKSINIIGSCNGILCVYECGKGFSLWNPSIRRKVTIPDPPPSGDRLVHGFGFDPVVQDYKVLRKSKAGSFVYTVKTRAWREIACSNPTFSSDTRISDVKSYQCLFNGVLHWIVDLTDSFDVRCYSYIMTFDLSSEVFSTIELPEPSWETSVVTIVKGCLAVISSKRMRSRIWVMREYANPGSWFVAFRFDTNNPFAGAKRVYEGDMNGYLLFNNSKGIGVCKPKTGLKWELQKLSRSRIADMNICVESLELLDMGTSCDHGSKLSGKKEKHN